MYRNLQANPIIQEIWCIPYENICLNGILDARCIATFPDGIPQDAYIVYSPSEEGLCLAIMC